MARPAGRAALAAALAAAYGVAILVVDPFDGPTRCPLLHATGLHCPGCGSTRASWLLLHGDIPGALRHNVLVLPVVVLLAGRWLHLAAPGRSGWLPRWVRSPTEAPRIALLGLAATFVAFGALRNLPGLDDWLAPPG